jgi:hypothetical protein
MAAAVALANGTLAAPGSARGSAFLAARAEGSIDAIEGSTAEFQQVAERQGLLFSMPKDLLGKQMVFGGVITGVSNRTSEELGRLKLSELPPLNVKPVIVSVRGGGFGLALLECKQNCTSANPNRPIITFPVKAVDDAQGLVVYVANTTTQPGQTDGFSIADHVRVVSDYLGGSGLDTVLVNDDAPPDHLRAHYAERGVTYLEPTTEELARVEELGVRAVTAPVIDKWSGPRDLWLKQDTIRHDAARVASALLRLVDERRPRLRALP